MTTEVEEKKDVVPSQYRDRYKETGGTCGDFIAVKLQDVAKDGSLDTIKAENNIEADRWSTFNTGMQRMNLANVLRGRYLKGETIVLLGKQYNAKHQSEDFNFNFENTPASLKKAASILELQDNDRTIKALEKLFFAPEKAPAKPRGNALLTKVNKKLASAQKSLAKAKEALETANTAATDAGAAVKAAPDDKAKATAEKALLKANEKAGKAEDKVSEAEGKVKEAEEAVSAATPATTE